MLKNWKSLSFSPFIDGYYDTENQLPAYIYRKARNYFRREYEEKSLIKTREEFEERRNRIRRFFINTIGGLPEEKTPLNDRTSLLIEKNGYKIYKVLYESLPKFYVTGLLYIPEKLESETAGILFVSGHAKSAKAYPPYQKVCIDLVQNEFVVLAIDPIGQGERLQYWDPKKGEVIRWGTYEHSYAGLQHYLIGNNIAKRFIWDGIRGIDYLIKRKEVNPKRIGVTGSSGGGTQTSYLMLVDERISAAAPCTYITSREEYMYTGQAHDAEQNIFGAIKYGLNYDDFLTSFAPKPLLIGAAAYDFFCIEGTLKSYNIAKRIYSLYGAEDKVKLVVGPHVHMYSDYLRESVVNWFRVHLMELEPTFKVDKINVEDEETLRVTASGQVLEDFPSSKTVYHLNLDDWNRVKPMRQKIGDLKSLERYIKDKRREIIELLYLDMNLRDNEIYPRIISTVNLGEYIGEKLFFFSEPGITLTGSVIYNKNGNRKRPAMIVLFENGTDSIEDERSIIESLIREDNLVFVLDVRGVGGVKVRKINPAEVNEIYGTEFRLAYDAFMLGTSTFALRVFDVLRGFDYLIKRDDVDANRIGIYGKDIASLYALFAMFLEPRIKRGIFENMLFSYEDVIETRIYNRKIVNEKILVPGILKHFDIVDLIPMLAGRKVEFRKLIDAKGRIVTKEKLEGKWNSVIDRYYPVINKPTIIM